MGGGLQSLDPSPQALWIGSAGDLIAELANPDGAAELFLLPGVYVGDFVIERPVRLAGALGAVLVGSGAGTVLTIRAQDVLVENLLVVNSGRRFTAEDAAIRAKGRAITVRGCEVADSLFGIALEQCVDCEVRSSRVQGPSAVADMRGDGIKLWEAHGSRVIDNWVERSRDVVVWYSRDVEVAGNVVTGSRYGTHFMYAHRADVVGNRYVNNVVGVFVMYSRHMRLSDNHMLGADGSAGMGVGAKESEWLVLSGNWLVANTTGIYLDNSPRNPDEPLLIEGNVLALNGVGLRLHSSERGASFLKNDFVHNRNVIEVEGGGHGLGLVVRGNYFSDYAGFDLDHDGLGDLAYDVKALSQTLTDRLPTLKLFSSTLALAILDTVSRAFPTFVAKQLLVDEQPSMFRLWGQPE